MLAAAAAAAPQQRPDARHCTAQRQGKARVQREAGDPSLFCVSNIFDLSAAHTVKVALQVALPRGGPRQKPHLGLRWHLSLDWPFVKPTPMMGGGGEVCGCARVFLVLFFALLEPHPVVSAAGRSPGSDHETGAAPAGHPIGDFRFETGAREWKDEKAGPPLVPRQRFGQGELEEGGVLVACRLLGRLI
jgi:hypothetical protein